MSTSSTGLVVGVVLGVVCFLALNAGTLYIICQKRRKKQLPVSTMPKLVPQPVPALRRSTEELLQQLKEQEFECHDIEICVDSYGNEIELGSGGFGKVIKGVRDGVQPVAIKMMFRTDQKAQEDFLQEIKLLKQLSRDANIVQYFGASLQENQIWLVTEFMEGGDLRKALSADDENRLTWWNGGKQIALDTARGLAFLHSRQVIHRDIKSHNILLTREGRAKIADVGMAQIMSDNYYANSQQGTFAWASPELILREGRCTEKVDIYSFGVCLWEIVTSQMPKRSEMFCPSPDECPAEVTRLIQDCMRRNPRDRPSAREIYRRLRLCDPKSEDSGQLILDSAEAGGRSARAIDKAQHGVFYPLETAPEMSPIHLTSTHDSPMSTHEELLCSAKVLEQNASEPPLPPSNQAFTQLVAKYSQAGSTQALTTSPEDIMATSISSVDADLSHIPSVHDSMNLERTGLPDFVLNTNDSRYLDYTQTHSSEDIYNTQPALTTLSLNMPLWFSQTQSSEDIHSTRLGYATYTDAGEQARSESSEDTEDNDTVAVAVASLQGYAGSSKANSCLNTETHSEVSLMTGPGLPAAVEELASKDTERAQNSTPESTDSDSLELQPYRQRLMALAAGNGEEAVPLAEDIRQPPVPGGGQDEEPAPYLTARDIPLHTGASSLHTGSTTVTVWEDADEQPFWLKEDANVFEPSLFKISVNTC